MDRALVLQGEHAVLMTAEAALLDGAPLKELDLHERARVQVLVRAGMLRLKDGRAERNWQ